MKKKLKIFSIILLALILIGGGYLLYLFKFKEYDVADEEIDKIIEDAYEVELPDGSIIIVDEQGELIEKKEADSPLLTESTEKDGEESVSKNANDASGEEKVAESEATDTTNTTQSNKKTETSKATGNKTAGSTGDKDNKGDIDNSTSKPTVAEIKNNYTTTFQNLEAQAEGKINALVSRAKNEYKTKKADGESISYSYFYNKYMGAAKALEAQTDAVFYATVGVVEKEFERNGYNKSYAQSFVDEYEATKKSRRENLLNQALGR